MYVRGSSYLSRILYSKKNGTSAEFQNVSEIEYSFRRLEKNVMISIKISPWRLRSFKIFYMAAKTVTTS
jgi:hypothetical protein